MPNIIPPDKKPVSSVLSKVQQFVAIKRQLDDLTKEQTQIKAYLSDLVDREGEPDDKGHLWYPLEEEVDGYRSLQRQRKVSQSLDADAATRILNERGLADRCYSMQPVLNEDEVMACLYEGKLSEEDIDTMFPKKIIWAFIPSKHALMSPLLMDLLALDILSHSLIKFPFKSYCKTGTGGLPASVDLNLPLILFLLE